MGERELSDGVEAAPSTAWVPSYEAYRAALDAALAIPDPEQANLDITCAHYGLSHLLAHRLGPDAGANFHTWAVWGSREAGTTIGRRDIQGLTPTMTAVGAVLGGVLGLAGRSTRSVAAVAAVGAATGGLTTWRLLQVARHHIAHGNRIVIDEIGGATARFATLLAEDTGPDDARLAEFVAWLKPGAAEDGGQDDLARAFTAYYRAIWEPDRERRHQLVFVANCIVVAHEHVRLQTDIANAMPRFLRRWITRTLLDFRVGQEELHVAQDLKPIDGALYPPTLATLVVPEAIEAEETLRDHRRPEGTLVGSGASDWSSYVERMDYVVELFRSRHLQPDVFAEPYPGEMLDPLPHVTT